VFKSAKKLQEGDKLKIKNGELVDVVTVQRSNNRRVTPHMPMIAITYLAGPAGNLQFVALFRLNQKVEVFVK
jgi:hypothetical protein